MSTAVADRLFDRDQDADEHSPWTTFWWCLCFLITVALHVGVAWLALHWQPAEEPALPPPAAVMIDLAPQPVAPPAPPAETPPRPQQEVSAPPPPEPEVQPILPPAPPAPVPKVEVPLPPKAEPLPTPKERVVLREPPKPRPDDKPPAPATTAPPQVQAPPSPALAAPAPGAAAAPSPRAVPTWQALLLGRLEQFKRYPHTAELQHQQGVAYLRFSIDRHGRVLSARIEKSSGFESLDQETLALVHRAEPLPPPPPEMPGDPIQLVVPVQFFLK